ncbi:methyltransferase domain-containing protein [uncultured Roseibium sp.]|uniref:class I SAM-dependent methyltransferase n=1 Tax=uncultured Roseibium sp. TaxID=1936171 RepID=UPI002627F1FF|nr:methyltransferase domain-containing protein [uncultured Roseibium sp.]
MCSSSSQHDLALTRHAASLASVYWLVDRQLSPLGLRAMDVLDPGQGDTVLDVGCGAGQTLTQFSERVGTNGRVIGVDIAPALLSIAQERCKNDPCIELIQADAQVLDLRTASLDGIYSRFGVMGFANPTAAFGNFRRLLRPGGRLAFCCWRTFEENELDYFPVEAAGRIHDVRESPFSFSDPNTVRVLLENTGFTQIAFEAFDANVSCGDLNATVEVVLSVGALGQIVREKASLRSEIEPLLRKALAARFDTANVEFKAAVWIVSARTAGP